LKFFNPTHDTTLLIQNCLEAASILSRSIPFVYVVNTRELDVDVAIQIMSCDSKFTAERNVVLTKSTIPRQHLYYVPNSTIMVPNSNHSKCWDYAASAECMMSVVSPPSSRQRIAEDCKYLKACHIPLYYAISGKREYGIPSIPGYGPRKTCDLLNGLAYTGVLPDTWYEYETLVERLMGCESFTSRFTPDQSSQIMHNIKACLIRYQHRYVTAGQLTGLSTQIVDLPDFDRVETISMQYHFANPIRTNELWQLP
jgi:hypothetical protein